MLSTDTRIDDFELL